MPLHAMPQKQDRLHPKFLKPKEKIFELFPIPLANILLYFYTPRE